jgi:predicted nucleotidyltransferase
VSSIADVIRGLNSSGVSYVVVGGVAVVLHGRLRTTMDLDLVIALDAPNINKALEVLAGLGLKPRLPIDPAGFADEQIRRHWIQDKGMMVLSFVDPILPTAAVDIFAAYPMDYRQLLNHSIVTNLGDIPARVCSLEHLISMKRMANRPHDLADIVDLEQILRAKNEF